MKRILILVMSFFISSSCAGAYFEQHLLVDVEIEEDYDFNFHTVEEGKFLRSGQLPKSLLEQYIDSHGIGMVINLRSKSEDSKEFDDEKELCKKKRVMFFNIPMCADDLPSRGQVQLLLSLYEFALLFNLKILIHCYAGIDRTGLAAALWVFQRLLNKQNFKRLTEEGPISQVTLEEQDCKQCVIKKDIEEARKKALEQLTPKYGGRFPELAKVFFIKIWQGKEWFERYYKPETYQVPCDRYIADKRCCERTCCDFFCDCGEPPCFLHSRYWEAQFGKLNLCCK